MINDVCQCLMVGSFKSSYVLDRFIQFANHLGEVCGEPYKYFGYQMEMTETTR